MAETSVLPSSMQARRAALEAPAETQPVETPTPVVAPAPVEATPAEAERVTISRAEFNAMQASADKTRAAEGRLEMQRMDMEAMKKRLTELEDASKASPKAPAPAPASSADTWAPSADAEITDKDREDYGDSIPLIEKIATNVVNRLLKELLPTLEGKIGRVKEIAESTAGAVVKSTVDAYTAAVSKEVGNMEECVDHEHWPAFLESFDEDTSLQVGQLVRNHIDAKNIRGMVKLFDKFKEKYGVGKPKPSSTGYEGAAPGGSTVEESPKADEQKLPFSKRKEAHDKYIKGQIDNAEYERIKEQYTKADSEGRVDYNK